MTRRSILEGLLTVVLAHVRRQAVLPVGAKVAQRTLEATRTR